MRQEKQYLVEEVSSHLNKSDYVYLVNYEGITVDEIAELRAALDAHAAEFHVVKNSILNVAATSADYPDMSNHLSGQTAIVVGGDNPSGVAKAIGAFFKDKEKIDLKVGVLNDKLLDRAQIETLAKLPGLEALRGQLLGLFSQPATSLVRVFNAVPQSTLNVLQAKARSENGG